MTMNSFSLLALGESDLGILCVMLFGVGTMSGEKTKNKTNKHHLSLEVSTTIFFFDLLPN